VVVVSIAGVVACMPSPVAPPPSATPVTSSTAPSSTSSPADVVKQKALDVYLGMWHNMAGAARTSDWRAPSLSEYATGQALNTISRGLYADHRNGLVTKGAPRNEPQVAAVTPADEPTRVTISDCGDSTHWLKYRADTGKPANDGPGGRRAITAIVDRQDDGRWQVSDFAVRAVGTC
jgi:hypothetical protein